MCRQNSHNHDISAKFDTKYEMSYTPSIRTPQVPVEQICGHADICGRIHDGGGGNGVRVLQGRGSQSNVRVHQQGPGGGEILSSNQNWIEYTRQSNRRRDVFPVLEEQLKGAASLPYCVDKRWAGRSSAARGFASAPIATVGSMQWLPAFVINMCITPHPSTHEKSRCC